MLITAWGLVCTFMGFIKSFAGLIICRFLLGMFEGGLLGGILVYLAMFYRRHAMVYRIGLFYCAAPLSGAFGGLLASGLAKIEFGGYNRWPWIFFSKLIKSCVLKWANRATVEGAITVVFGLVCFITMPNTPSDAKFLSEEERLLAMIRLKEDSHGANTVEDVNEEKFRWHWVRMAFRAPQTYFCSVAWILLLIPLYVRQEIPEDLRTCFADSFRRVSPFSCPVLFRVSATMPPKRSCLPHPRTWLASSPS